MDSHSSSEIHIDRAFMLRVYIVPVERQHLSYCATHSLCYHRTMHSTDQLRYEHELMKQALLGICCKCADNEEESMPFYMAYKALSQLSKGWCRKCGMMCCRKYDLCSRCAR